MILPEERQEKIVMTRQISITEIDGIRIGNEENAAAGTGVTVLISEQGMDAGLSVRGGGPATRESTLLDPLTAAQKIHAVLFAGGSSFGLDAAGGVMRYLEERGFGMDVSGIKVPLVCESCIFDLRYIRGDIRPDGEMAYQACENAWKGNYRDGNFGAGCGATVGKQKGMEYCMKSGIGSYAVQMGELKIGAVVVVNALGDVYDWRSGNKIAGLLNDTKTGFLNTEDLMEQEIEALERSEALNTTLGAIITNAKFAKPSLCKIADMANDAYARCIRPVHTTIDGDCVYALSVGEVTADQDLVGTLAADMMCEAILRAVKSAGTAGGCPSVSDLPF